MAAEIFRLVGSIFVDTASAEKSLSKTDDKAQSFGSTLVKGIKGAAKWGTAIVGAATAVGAAMYKAASSAAANADEIDKMSQKIGISRTAYQELDFILSQNGMDVNVLQSGMKKLVNTMQDAQSGSATAKAAFDALGVSVTDSNGALRDQETVLYDAIAALQGMENETERNALANDLFGRSASEMAPLLNAGAGSMEELRQKARDLGLVLGDETIDAGVKFTDTIDQAKRAGESIMTQIGAQVMPLFVSVLEWIMEHMPEIQDVLGRVFGVAKDVISGIGNLVSWLSDLLDGELSFVKTYVRETLGGILDFISGVFTGDWEKAWQGVSRIFGAIWDGIKGMFKLPINWIIDGINKFIRGINGIKVPDWVPLVGGKGFSIKELPRLAKGGVLERGQTGFLEGNGAEAVVPLHDNRKWIGAVAEDMDRAMGAGASGDKVLAALLKMVALLEQITGMRIYLYPDKLVGELADPMDERLGRIRAQKARG